MDGKKTTTEIESLKSKLLNTWEAGDFSRIAAAYAPGAIEFVDRLGLTPGLKVLDVACGAGNLAIPAAKYGADVIGLDIVPYLIDQARVNARAEGVDAEFEEGDAEAMPYADETFDVVMSMFGAMFAPRPDLVVKELKRVCKPGGVIAMANWTPAGFIGQMFRINGRHVPPPAVMPSPVLWGDVDTVRQRFAEDISDLTMTKRHIDFNFPFGPVDVVEHFRKFYGPTFKSFQALDEKGQADLRRDLEEHWTVGNRAANGATLVHAEYLEVKAVRRQN